MNGKQKKGIIGTAVIAVIVVVLLVFNIVMAVNYDSIAEANGTMTTTTVTRASALSDGTQVATELEQEGATLLYNEDETLPLIDSNGTSKKVTILGASSFNYTQGGTGSAGGRDDDNTAMMDVAFENAGIDYNEDAWGWMQQVLAGGSNTHNAVSSGVYDSSTVDSGDDITSVSWTDYTTIHEFSIETYEANITSSVIGDYDDVAIVTFSRSGAEGASPSLDFDGNNDTTTGTTYLELQEDEIDLLKFCKENFDTTVVLINSAIAIETGFVENDDFNIGAVLWIGHPGEAGLYGVANVLAGKTAPSGHLVDTWGYDMSTNPTYYSANDQQYDGLSGSKSKYYQYNEGIYVGYRYYETADAEGFFDSDEFTSTYFKGNLAKADTYDGMSSDYSTLKTTGPRTTYEGYDEVVQFPFGYGLSYTEFDQEITSSSISLTAGGTNSVSVKVTNEGDTYSGKSVVQLYMEAPYGEDDSFGISGVGLEKPKVELIGFAKTSELAPGKSETVTITFNTDDLATFDEFGSGGYVLEKGTYTFHVSPNAHGWANEEAYGVDYDTVSATLSASIDYVASNTVRTGTMNGVTATEGKVAVNAMNDVTAGDGTMLVNGGYSGTYTYGYLSRKDFGAGMEEIMKYQSDDDVGLYSDGGSRTPATAVSEQITTSFAGNTNNYIDGLEYNYADLLANGVSFGDGGESKTLYGYGNDVHIAQRTTRDGLSQDDESYLYSDSGVEIQWNATYYVALDAEDETVKDTDGYVKIYDTESAAAAEGEATLLQCEHMDGVPADDLTRWDKLANMMSFEEADDLMGENGWHCYAADSVGKIFRLAVDGPGEAGNAQNADCTWWPCAVIIAATWNIELAEDEGVAYANQDLLNNVGYAYAPAMNTHRTPFGGRDFEYYSEDGFIAGVIGGNVVQGMQSTGLHVFIKHFALNDSDTNRGGVNTWADEMSVRQIYMKPYEICTKYFEADGMMGSLNSIGMAWSHSGMYQDITRDEWQWHGMLITDGDGSSSDTYNQYSYWTFGTEGGILGSGDLHDQTLYWSISSDGTGATNYQNFYIHNIGRNALYQYSHNIDNLNANTTMTPNTLVPTLIIVITDVVLAAAAVIVFFTTTFPWIRSKGKSEEEK